MELPGPFTLHPSGISDSLHGGVWNYTLRITFCFSSRHKNIQLTWDSYLTASASMAVRAHMIGDLVSKETVCCVGGKVKH